MKYGVLVVLRKLFVNDVNVSGRFMEKLKSVSIVVIVVLEELLFIIWDDWD